MVKIALIIGSTRPNRFADIPAQWMAEGAKNRAELEPSVLDLRDFNLPFLAEPVPPAYTGGVYANAEAEAWRTQLGAFDGFIVTAAEYNGGPTAAIKNAFDSAHLEWRRKPVAFVGYGGLGGSRAIEALKVVAVSLDMAPLRAAVNISMEPFLGILKHGKTLDDYDYLGASREQLFDDLIWWANALKLGREC